jgi:hypothetical protein
MFKKLAHAVAKGVGFTPLEVMLRDTEKLSAKIPARENPVTSCEASKSFSNPSTKVSTETVSMAKVSEAEIQALLDAPKPDVDPFQEMTELKSKYSIAALHYIWSKWIAAYFCESPLDYSRAMNIPLKGNIFTDGLCIDILVYNSEADRCIIYLFHKGTYTKVCTFIGEYDSPFDNLLYRMTPQPSFFTRFGNILFS